MPPVGKRLHLRLFLEGIEVPVISAAVQTGINGPTAASIQVIPLDSAMEMHARTMVHLFYLDDAATTWNEDKTTNVRFSTTKGTYRLLFAGEMVGYQFQQTPASRALVLQCLDFSSYWDTAHATALEYGAGGNALVDTSYVHSSTTALFDDIINQQAQRLVWWLHDTPKTPGLNSVTGLAGGVIRIMEAMGGVPNYQKGVNDFFTVAELRCRLMEQITAEENDNTAANLLSVQVFDEWLRNGLQNMGQNVTFRDLMKLLFGYVFYEMVPNPTAMFVDSSRGGEDKTIEGATYLVKDHPTVVSVVTKAKELRSNAQERVGQKANFLNFWSSFWSINKKSLEDIKGALRTLSSSDVTKAIAEAERALNWCTFNLKVEKPSSWAPAENLVDPLTKLIDILTVSQNKTKASSRLESSKTVQRLRSQILRPDCWFSPPPACNVIFPEQYVSLSFERNYLGETTRVLVQLYNTLIENNPGSNDAKLLTTKILAPNFGQFTSSLVQQTNEHSYRVLMQHELHTGIVPREDWIPNTAATSTDKADKEKAYGSRLSWGQRVALYNFFKYRYAHRQAAVAGRFNPSIVCGFPAAVIRGPYLVKDVQKDTEQSTLDYVLAHAEQLKAPYHLIGMVGSVSHNIDQAGGTTSVTMHHVRRHMGSDDEFLRIAQGSEKMTVTRSINFDLEEIEKMPSGASKTSLLKYLTNLTPQDPLTQKQPAKTAQATTTTAKGETTTKESEKKAPATISSLVQKGQVGGETVLIPAGSPKVTRGSEGPEGYGKVKAVIVQRSGDYSGTAPNRKFKLVTVMTDIEVETSKKIAAEEIIRPRGWFSPKYSNGLIGKEIYKHFFGCMSILDAFGMGDSSTSAPPDPAPIPATDIDTQFVAKISLDEASRVTQTVEKSLNALAYYYGKVKTSDSDVESFVKQYTYRPIATLDEMLGSLDLRLKVDAATGKASPTDPTQQIGFHTQAVHEDLVLSPTALAGLVSDLSTQLPRINDSGKSAAIPAEYDIRRANHDRVMAYANALREKRAFRG